MRPEGVVLGKNLGDEFSIGGEVPEAITIKLGKNLYRDSSGTIHAVTSTVGLTWIDWGWVIFAWGWTLILGFVLGRFMGEWDERTSWAVVAMIIVFITGVGAHFLWRHRRHPIRPRSPRL